MDILRGYVNDALESFGLSGQIGWLDTIIILFIIFILAYILNFVCNKVLLNAFKKIADKTKNTWDDLIVDRKIINKLINIVPAIFVYILLPLVFPNNPNTLDFFQRVCLIYIVAVSLRFINSSLSLMHEISNHKEELKTKPLKGFIQIIQVIIVVVGIILIISVLIKESPVKLLAGLGASAAILTLVFKDTILGFLAGIQLSTNDMLRPGDWITMNKYGADGTVVEVTLYAVRVRNWDNTITTIPPYALISDSFQNWRGMFESAGRRIKRSIYIDMNSVHFCTPEMLERFHKIDLIKDYIDGKECELKEFNKAHEVDESVPVNGRKQTNLGVFRNYLLQYLRNNPAISKELICMVRHLQPTEKGIPIELYCFSADRAWVVHEGVQADIFDHILAIIPEFELQVFQNVSGYDLSKIKVGNK